MKSAFFRFAMFGFLASALSNSVMSATALAQEPKPADVLDLSGWKISLPIDTTGNGKATQIEKKEIAGGYMLADHFYVNEAGDGVVFSSPIKGVLT